MNLFRLRRIVLALALVCSGAVLNAQGVRYIYDAAGRLVAVVDQNGDSAVYTYDLVGNLLSITRHTAGTVSILQFSPESGSVGTTVTLFGVGFSATPGQNTVTFNGTAATVTASTTTSITTTVPSGATTGTIAVTSPSGSATSSTAFTVAASTAPTITGFTPAIGTPGTSVTISGTNFDTTLLNNRVALNLTRAWPSSGSATSLQSAVPTAAGSGKISVITPNGTAISAADFFVPPSPYGPSDVIVTDRIAIGDSRAVAINTASKVGLVIFDAAAGSRISLKAVSGPTGAIKMYRPDLGLIASEGIGVFAILLEPALLTHTGTYSILVDPNGTSTGTTTLTLYNVPPDFAGSIVAGGSNATPVQVHHDRAGSERQAVVLFRG